MEHKFTTIEELILMGADTEEWNLPLKQTVIVSEDGSVDLPNGSEVDGPCELIAKLFPHMEQ